MRGMLSGDQLGNITEREQITVLDLSWNSIVSISNETFRCLPKLKTLSLSHNRINFSTTYCPFRCLSRLENLDISDNVVPSDDPSHAALFGNLSNLLHLTTDGVPPSSLPTGLASLEMLNRLTVKGNLVFLSNRTFSDLRKLGIKNLAIKCSCLTHIEAGAFRELSYLECLELHDLPFLKLSSLVGPWTGLGQSVQSLSLWRVGGLTRSPMEPVTVEEEFFRSLSNTGLKRLEMDDNYITLIHLTHVWRYLGDLEYFSLAYNSLIQLSPLANSLQNLTKLRYLDVSQQYRTSFMTGPEFYMRDCRHLLKRFSPPLSNVRAHEGPTQSKIIASDTDTNSLHIYYPPALEYYNISFALFQTNMYELHIHQADNVKLLNVAGNRIKVLGSKLVFVDKPKHGITMDVSGNEIINISYGYFDLNSTATVIERLILRANQLGDIMARIGCDCISSLRNLKHIDLSDNRIKTLPFNTFHRMDLLETINVGNNSIRNFDLSLSDHISLKHLDLSNNLIQQFGGKMMDKLESLAERHNLTISLLGNPLFCSCHTLTFLRWVKRHRDGGRIRFDHLDSYTCLYGGKMVYWKALDGIIADIRSECDKNLYIKVGSSLGAFVVLVFALSIFIYRHKWDIKFWLIGRVIDRKAKRDEAERGVVRYRYDAFVSYHQKDIEWVIGVLLPEVEGCEANQMRLCLHHRDFEPGAPIEENIVQSIKNSRKTLLVVSRQFLTSHWCHFEIQMARTKSFDIGRDVIVPILIEPALEIMKDPNLSKTLLNIFRRRTYLEWPSDPLDQAARIAFRDSLHRVLRCPISRRIRCECGRSVCPSPASHRFL
ncbi:hypothetical protein LSH36_320g05002 [Paralvinella palmiformis]|uniref:TIR domain-containing protein n=1 Tax=Paralvinella palmiformis TaxID=53620 RepID=A0AAD9JHA8_9ANNE|nr:hypothetical protein LSH36_320g05002 [Paralvinella palmiformis]